MPSTKTQINARVTDEELAALKSLMKLLELNQAEAIRHCIIARCHQLGITVNETMPKPGTHKRGKTKTT